MKIFRSRTLVAILMVLTLALSACAASTPAPAADPKPTDPKPAAPKTDELPKLTAPVEMRIASGPSGGGWYAMASSLAEVIRPDLPQGSTIDILPQALGVGNVLLLQQEKAEFGLLFNISNAWGAKGVAAFADKGKQDKVLAVMSGLMEYYGGIMIRKGSGIATLKDVADKKMKINLVTQNPGSTSEYFTRQVLEHYNLDYEKIKSWGGTVTMADYNQISRMAADETLDVLITVMNAGHPTFTEISLTTEIAFVPLPDDLISFLSSEYGFIPATMPANTFPKQTNPVKQVAALTTLGTRAGVPDEVVYQVTKSVIEGSKGLMETYKSMAIYDVNKTWTPGWNGIPLHPGAERYYKDAGIMK